ncbi:uracil-O(2)--methyltransferase [Scheffersomyces amazonensis]|uniref:uracil-O(2)--methyltransferase n=1 Tax=Scheffersomyces amazonensis TaxID=1078765 RepID=UPI00315CF5C1
MNKGSTNKDIDIPLLHTEESILGKPWLLVYKKNVEFEGQHFETAMSNLIKQPNINSTVIMRADILKENIYDPEKGDTMFVSKLINQIPEFPSSDESTILKRDLTDVELRSIPLDNSKIQLQPKFEIIRRIIPRNPFKDYIINQTCLVLTDDNTTNSSSNNNNDTILVVYIPHISSKDEIPFYLPEVYGVGILYHKKSLSIHYLPFGYKQSDIEYNLVKNWDPTNRSIRIALRLLETSAKHSNGVMAGYEKRVNHDMVVPKIAFQNRYISLKKKYSSNLVNSWIESTDPKKHVFEDLAIAAFLIEFWASLYKSKEDFEFRDLGCGNGLLVYILNNEGYKGIGIDARARKSWTTYPEEVQKNLKEQVIIPSILLKPHPAVAKMAPHIKDNGRYFQIPDSPSYYSSANLLASEKVCTLDDFPKNTFIIGNHSDELTCWIPLLGFPYMVIPCCSHSVSGAKVRYNPRKSATQNSTYSSLVDHVEDLSITMGWDAKKEMLRIPSTRNAAIIGSKRNINESLESYQTRILDILALEGGTEGWVENSIALMKRPPRNH